MPKRYTFAEVHRVLTRSGFFVVSQVGSHVKFRKLGHPTLTAIVPKKKNAIPAGTMKSILRQSHLTHKEFLSILED